MDLEITVKSRNGRRRTFVFPIGPEEADDPMLRSNEVTKRTMEAQSMYNGNMVNWRVIGR